MRKGTVTAGFLLLALVGCRGTASDLPSDFVMYKFEATVAVNPTAPVPNRRVNFTLEVTSASTRSVKTDIILKVVSEQGETMYEQVWSDVLFHENEVWNLTQGFLPDSDAARKPWKVTLLVRNKDTLETLYNKPIATLDFSGQ